MLLFITTSCVRKPLYLQKDCILDVGITVETTTTQIFWKSSWKDSLVYNWDEALYGKIGYSEPEEVNMVFIHNGKIEAEGKIKPNSRATINLDFNKNYKVVFFNKTNTIESYLEDSYYIESIPGATFSRATYIDDNYDTVEQPGEVFHLYVNSLYLSDDYTDYDEIYENGRTVYIYNIDAELKPISYIYIVQFIVVNDDNTEIEAKMINNFTISGISSKSDLFGAKTVFNGRKQISSTDIKPIQNMGDSVVFASRITMLGRQPDTAEDGSWTEYKNNLYFTSMDVLTNSYGTVSGVKDITTQLNENPKGGIITVRIMNSELKTVGTSGSGFGIDVNEWNTHYFNIGS